MPTKIELSFSEAEEILESVVENKKLFQVQNSLGEEVWLFFCFPRATDKMIARAIRQKALLEAEKEGLPTIEEMDVTISKRGLLTKEDINKLEELDRNITVQKKLLDVYKIEIRKQQVQDAINSN